MGRGEEKVMRIRKLKMLFCEIQAARLQARAFGARKGKRGNAELQGNEPDRDVLIGVRGAQGNECRASGFRHPFRMLLIAISVRQDWSVSAPASSNLARRNGPPGAGSLKLDAEIKLKSLHFVALRFAFE